jgi:hypothetical protein
MLTVKELISQSKSHRPVLVSNASIVSISFKPTNVGKDALGYYRSIKGSALTNQKGKKTKTFEIRLYWGGRGTSQYIPAALRQKGKPYVGPENPPPFTLMTKAWVSCSCEYFLYNCEVADAEEDSSSIKYSNGKGYSPTGPNPHHIPHICKHLIGALRKGALVKK